MRRLPLLALAATAALAVLVPGIANAKVPCRDRIYNDWYQDGKIASTYSLGCYRDALKHVPIDAQIYSSLDNDIRSALQAAVDRTQGKQVPQQVGRGLPDTAGQVKDASIVRTTKRDPGGKLVTLVTPGRRDAAPVHTPARVASSSGEHVAAPVAATTSSGGGGLPVPILVLGALAIVLAATGVVGAGIRYFRR